MIAGARSARHLATGLPFDISWAELSPTTRFEAEDTDTIDQGRDHYQEKCYDMGVCLMCAGADH